MMNNELKFFKEWTNPNSKKAKSKRLVVVTLTSSILFTFCYHVVNIHQSVRNNVIYYKRGSGQDLSLSNINSRVIGSKLMNSEEGMCFFNQENYDTLKGKYRNHKLSCSDANSEVMYTKK